MKENLEYPEDAVEDEIECNLEVRFTIDEHGRVTGIELLKLDVEYYGFEGMVYEVLGRMPAWNPAIIGNKFSKEEVVIEVSFFLEY